MRPLTISTSPSRFVSTMHRQTVSWRAFTAKLSRPVVSKETFAEYLSWDKEQQNASKDVGFYVAGAYENDLRRNAEYQSRSVVTLDIDLPGADFEERLTAAFGKHAFYWHTTRKHCPERPRIRVHIPLAADINDAEKFQALTRLLASQYDIEAVDRVSFIVAQMMYFPSVCSDGEFRFGRHDGPWLDPDEALLSYFFDWHARDEWPRAKAEPPPETRTDKVGNPLAKPGIIGAFCRAFRITEVIETHLAGVYEPAGENRWRYHAAEGAGGALVFDQDTALYSFHTGHDPVAGRSTNAFDLVRIHKFGALDKAAEERGEDLAALSPTELPSFRAMQELAMSLPEVVAELTAVEAFEELPEEDGAGDQDRAHERVPAEVQEQSPTTAARGAQSTLPAEVKATDRLAASRARLRAAVADCEEADALVDALVPQVVGAALGPVEEARMLEAVADRHQELTGRRLSLVALKQQAGELRKKMEARTRAGVSEREQTALQQAMELEGVVFGEKGAPTETVANMVRALKAGAGGWTIAFDQFQQTEVLRPPAGSSLGSGWRTLDDVDYVAIRMGLEAVGFTKFGGGNDLVKQAVAWVARQNAFDSAQQWLGELLWDGTPRVERFLSKYLGVVDEPYTRAVALYLWTALAGRVLTPGVKADMMVTLFGPTGARKSTTIGLLAPFKEWAATLRFNDTDEQKIRKMHGKLVIEVSELRGFASADEDGIKTFLSTTEDEWVQKYRERASKAARRAVFFGTTDKQRFLDDIAGNRRHLPVKVAELIDTDAIVRDREQLWAEAAELYLKGGVRFAAEVLARDVHAEFTLEDPWEERIEAWLEREVGDEFRLEGDAPGRKNGDGLIQIAEVLHHAIGIPFPQIRRKEIIAGAKIFKKLGYVEGFSWVGGKSRRGWARK